MNIKDMDFSKPSTVIVLRLMADDRHEINIETYVDMFNPCARQRVGTAFADAVRQGVIELTGINKRGKPIYRRTADCRELMR